MSERIKINLNDIVFVKLRPDGEKIFEEYYACDWSEGVDPIRLRESRTNERGEVRMHIHEMMNIFGKYTGMGLNLTIDPTVFVEREFADQLFVEGHELHWLDKTCLIAGYCLFSFLLGCMASMAVSCWIRNLIP